MKDRTTEARPCARCSGPLPEASSLKLKYCPPCRVIQTREDQLAGYHRRAAKARAEWAAVELTCPRCDSLFVRTKHYKVFDGHCHPCHEKLRMAVRNETKKATGKRLRAERYAREGRFGVCGDCDAILSMAASGRPREYCGPCWARRSALLRKQWLDAHPEFKKMDARRRVARRRSRIYGLGYESFRHQDIFNRDGWKCGICRKRISKRLKHPHPKSVSLDHIIPLSQGGQHKRSNVRAAHLVCNTARSNKGGGEQLLLVG